VSTKKQETHTRLLDAAAKLIRSDGIDVRLEDVARQANVSRQSVYLHFSSRAGLLIELFDYIDRQLDFDSGINEARNAPDPRSALSILVNKRTAYITAIQPFAGPFIAVRKSDPEVDAAYEDRQAARRRDYREIVERLSAEGNLASEWEVDMAVEAIRAILSIPTWELLVLEQGLTNDQYEQSMLTILEKTFLRSR
jgi:AcrR family transcriptional regulator